MPDSPFRFVEAPGSFRDAQALVVRIPRAARSKQKLLNIFARQLRFPHYFGWNWDALEECLRDLSWLHGVERIVVVHEALPFSTNGEQLATYLALLANAVQSRGNSSGGPKLEVIFPTSCQGAISDVLKFVRG